jgi:hypothetical protein
LKKKFKIFAVILFDSVSEACGLAIGYAYVCCARFGEARHLVGTGKDNNDQTPNVRATIF